MALEKVESQHVFMGNPRTWKIGEIPGKFEGGSWQVLFQSKKKWHIWNFPWKGK